jgi:hypothetical protein
MQARSEPAPGPSSVDGFVERTRFGRLAGRDPEQTLGGGDEVEGRSGLVEAERGAHDPPGRAGIGGGDEAVVRAVAVTREHDDVAPVDNIDLRVVAEGLRRSNRRPYGASVVRDEEQRRADPGDGQKPDAAEEDGRRYDTTTFGTGCGGSGRD